MYLSGEHVAVFSDSDPFWIARCSQDISANDLNNKKIIWLERTGVNKNGNLFIVGGKDVICVGNIICKVNLVKQNRFKYILSFAEEKRICNILEEYKNVDVSNIDISVNVPNTCNKSSNSKDVCLEMKANSDVEKSLKRNKIDHSTFKKYDTATISELNFDETASISRGVPISLTKCQIALLLSSNSKEAYIMENVCLSNQPHAITVNEVLDNEILQDSDNINAESVKNNQPHAITMNETLDNGIMQDSDNINAEIVKNNQPLAITLNKILNNEIMQDSDNIITESVKNNQPHAITINEILDNEIMQDSDDIYAEIFNNNQPLAITVNKILDNELVEDIDNINAKTVQNNQPLAITVNKILDNEIMQDGDYINEESINSFDSLESFNKNLHNINYNEFYDETEKENWRGRLRQKHRKQISTEVEDGDDIEDPFMSSGSEYLPQKDLSDRTCSSLYDSADIVLKEFSSESNVHEKDTKMVTTSTPVKNQSFEKSNLTTMSQSTSSGGLSPMGTSPILTISKKTKTGRRVYDKRHACYFCDAMLSKMTRHLESKHSNETEVARLLAMKQKSKERREKFLCLLRAGDYYHNCRVLTTKQGELILSRRPTIPKIKSIKDYGPCPHCLGFFLLDTLWRHVKTNCPMITSHPSGDTRRDTRGESYALLNSWSTTSVSLEFQQNILAHFINDNISDICKGDDVIVRFGSLIFEKFSSHQYEYVRQTMRQLGRFLLEIRNVDSSIITISDAILPKNFDILIKAIKKLCISDKETTKMFQIPSLALKLGHSLRKCAQIVRGMALRKGDLKLDQEMNGFLSIMEMEWRHRVSTTALRTLEERKMNCAQMLPITEDIIKLSNHLDLIIEVQTFNLKEEIDVNESWTKLASALLTRIILFNKRRSGEASRLTLNQYACRPSWRDESTSELKQSLTELERKLAERLIIIEVKGKSRKNPKVPILLTQQWKNSIDVLIQNRDGANINKKNMYVFARGGNSTFNLRGHDCIKQFSKELNLQKPELLTSTKLRKYVATIVQVFNLSENETDWLARHMGHDIRVHRQHYRLHESAVELTKVSRILLAIDKGHAKKYIGKPLQDIGLEDLSPLESEHGEDETQQFGNAEESEQNQVLESPEDHIFKEPRNGNSIKPANVSQTSVTLTSDINKKSKIPQIMRRPWSSEEKDAVLTFFRKNVKTFTVPNKKQCDECKAASNALSNRSWRDVKNYVYNYIKKVKNP